MNVKRTPPPLLSTIRITLLLGGSMIFHEAAFAAVTESSFFDELPVVLSVSRLLQSPSDAPVAVTVIDRDMIRSSGFRDIPDLLRLVPGFSVAYTRDNTWAAGYHGLGDAYSRRFQVLVDGRSIYSPHYGAVNWADLPLSIDDIERIEVVRGPNAAIHGANAFAAVINIISKTAAQVSGTSVSMQFGEQSMRGLTVRQGGGEGAVRYRLTASAQQRDRFERDVNGSQQVAINIGSYFEASKTYFVNGRLDWQISSSETLMAQFGVSQGDWKAGLDVAADSRSALEPRQQDSRAQYLQLAYHRVESARREWRVNAYFARNRFDANALTPLTYKGVDYGVIDVDQYRSQTRSNIELQVNEQWLSNLRGVWGGEVRQETVYSPQNYYASDKTLRGNMVRAFGNIEWRPEPRVLLQGGAMLEHHYFTGTDVSPRGAVNFTVTPGHVIRLGISRAYRSPTFFEEKGNEVIVNASGAVVDTVTVPSDGLAPERVLSREIGYVGQWRPLRLELDLRLYRDHIDNFIGQVRSGVADVAGSFQPKVFTAANIGAVDAEGGEIQLRWRPSPAWDVSAHYARVFLRTDTADRNFGLDIPQSAPKDSWGMLAAYRWGNGWESSVFAQRTATQKWLTEGDVTAAYTRIDVRLARRWNWQGHDIEAAVVGQNIGRDYEEFRDSNIFSRRVYGSLNLAW